MPHLPTSKSQNVRTADPLTEWRRICDLVTAAEISRGTACMQNRQSSLEHWHDLSPLICPLWLFSWISDMQKSITTASAYLFYQYWEACFFFPPAHVLCITDSGSKAVQVSFGCSILLQWFYDNPSKFSDLMALSVCVACGISSSISGRADWLAFLNEKHLILSSCPPRSSLSCVTLNSGHILSVARWLVFFSRSFCGWQMLRPVCEQIASRLQFNLHCFFSRMSEFVQNQTQDMFIGS